MGGFAVDRHHRTNLAHLYAIGECASIYHGANRLGGNSLLAAVHSGRVAAQAIGEDNPAGAPPDLSPLITDATNAVDRVMSSPSRYPAIYVKRDMATIMNRDLGITRDEGRLDRARGDIDYYLDISKKLAFDSDVSPYQAFSLEGMLPLARAIITCAAARKESRGAHIRDDFPENSPDYRYATLISFAEGRYEVEWRPESQAVDVAKDWGER